MNPYLGQLALVPYNFAPKGWALCAGQLLAISQNTALFSLLGVSFGGNGQSNFALPNLQACLPIGDGQGPGLSSYVVGETGGDPTVSLRINEMPMHNHGIGVAGGKPVSGTDPSNEVFGTAASPAVPYGPNGANLNLQLAAGALTPLIGDQPHENRAPYLVMNWIIAMEGVFPARS